MKKTTKVTQKDVLFVSVSMFIIVAIWLGLSFYHSWVTSTISDDLQLQIIPIAPNFNTKTLNDLKSREKIAPVFDAKAIPTASPTAAITIAPSIAPEEEILETPTPTEEPLPTEEIAP